MTRKERQREARIRRDELALKWIGQIRHMIHSGHSLKEAVDVMRKSLAMEDMKNPQEASLRREAWNGMMAKLNESLNALVERKEVEQI